MANKSEVFFECEHCNYKAVSLRRLLNHLYSEHSHDLNFKVNCCVLGCDLQFTKYNSLYKHVVKHHKNLYKNYNAVGDEQNNHIQNLSQILSQNGETSSEQLELNNEPLEVGIESADDHSDDGFGGYDNDGYDDNDSGDASDNLLNEEGEDDEVLEEDHFFQEDEEVNRTGLMSKILKNMGAI